MTHFWLIFIGKTGNQTVGDDCDVVVTATSKKEQNLAFLFDRENFQGIRETQRRAKFIQKLQTLVFFLQKSVFFDFHPRKSSQRQLNVHLPNRRWQTGFQERPSSPPKSSDSARRPAWCLRAKSGSQPVGNGASRRNNWPADGPQMLRPGSVHKDARSWVGGWKKWEFGVKATHCWNRRLQDWRFFWLTVGKMPEGLKRNQK